MEIPLTKGQIALIDDEDYDLISQYKWHVIEKHGYYANTKVKISGKQKNLSMHRLIMNAQPGQYVDHINHNTLDNRKSNLRICTAQQNQMNKKKKPGLSMYKGVAWDKICEKWSARIKFNGKNLYLGRFDEEIEAAKAYNEAASKYFGEFAHFNYTRGK